MERGDWEENELENIANTYKERFDPQENESRLYLGLKHIGKGTLRIEDVGDSKETKSSKKVFHSGDILFGRLRPYFRKIVQPNFNGVCSGEFIVIKGKDSINQKFLFYRLADENLVDRITKTCGGVERPRAKWSVIKDLKIKIPSLLTQKKIATILSNYDDLIENNSRRIELLEEMAKLIYKEWFVNFRFPGHEDIEMVYNEELEKEIPEGWKVKKLEKVIELSYGKGLRKKDRIKGPYPVYGSSGIIDYHNENIVEGPGIIIGRKGNVGSIFWADVGFCPIDTTYYVKTDLPLHYVFYAMKGLNLIDSAAAVPGLNRDYVYSLPFLVPDRELLMKFEKIIENIFDLISVLDEKNENLRQTREILHPRLVKGDIDVSDLDIDISDNVLEVNA